MVYVQHHKNIGSNKMFDTIFKAIATLGFPIVMCLLIYLDLRKKVISLDGHITNDVMHALVDIKESIDKQTELLDKKLN